MSRLRGYNSGDVMPDDMVLYRNKLMMERINLAILAIEKGKMEEYNLDILQAFIVKGITESLAQTKEEEEFLL